MAERADRRDRRPLILSVTRPPPPSATCADAVTRRPPTDRHPTGHPPKQPGLGHRLTAAPTPVQWATLDGVPGQNSDAVDQSQPTGIHQRSPGHLADQRPSDDADWPEITLRCIIIR